MGVASIAAALVFAYAAAVQINDPDPIRWLALYGSASLVCILYAAKRLPRFVPFVLAGIAGGWAATLLPGVVTCAALTGTEEERELAGLILVAAVCVVLGRSGSGRTFERRPEGSRCSFSGRGS